MRLRWLLAATFVVTCSPHERARRRSDPNWTNQTAGWNRSSSPVIADINGDGVPRSSSATKTATCASSTPTAPARRLAAARDHERHLTDRDRQLARGRRPQPRRPPGDRRRRRFGVPAEPQRRRHRVPQRRLRPVPLRDQGHVQHLDRRRTRRLLRRRLLHSRDRRRQRRRLPRHRVRELGPLRARDRPQLPRDLRVPVQRRRHGLVVARALRRRPRRSHGDLHRQRLPRHPGVLGWRVPRARLAERRRAAAVEPAGRRRDPVEPRDRRHQRRRPTRGRRRRGQLLQPQRRPSRLRVGSRHRRPSPAGRC